jgi:hypothetical protein
LWLLLECRLLCVCGKANRSILVIHVWHVGAAQVGTVLSFLDRGAEVLTCQELGSRDDAAESGIIHRTRQKSSLDVFHMVVTDEVVRHALVCDADSLLDQSLFLEVVRVDE